MSIKRTIEKISKVIISYFRTESNSQSLMKTSTKNFWTEDNHYNIFEANTMTLGDYGISDYAPGYKLIGLVGWDDFILKKGDTYYKIPTVPFDLKYLERVDQVDFINLNSYEDSDHNKIKWYETPIIFGGKPDDYMWVDIDTYQKLVAFWNRIYYQKNKN